LPRFVTLFILAWRSPSVISPQSADEPAGFICAAGGTAGSEHGQPEHTGVHDRPDSAL
jgi:hypothetical protein